MFGTSVIVFREVLEAAIIIGIIAAATRGIPGSRRWMIAGVLAGLAGSAVLARFADVIGSLASGIGQEIFNAIVLALAVLMLAWHNIWMASHGAVLASGARAVGSDVRDGRRACSVLFLIVGLAGLDFLRRTDNPRFRIAFADPSEAWPAGARRASPREQRGAVH